MQLKSAVSQSTPSSMAISPDLDQPGVVPRRVVAAELDLQALQPVAADPVAQQHGVAVVGLARR